MNEITVLRAYHSGVVDEYRQRDRLLRARHGYDTHLVCPPSWHEGGRLVTAESDPDVPVHVVDVRGRRHPILFWYAQDQFRQVVRQVRPQIVDLQEEPYSLAVWAALRVIEQEAPEAKVCIYSAQNIFKSYPPPFRQFEGRALRAVGAAYPCSTETGEVLRRKGFQGALHTLPLGVSIPSGPDQRAHREGGWQVGFVSRLEPYKGGHIAVEAFAKGTEGLDASLEVVGSGSQEDALRAMAEQLGIGPKVSFLGALSQEETLRRISSYDVLLIPSLTTRRWKEQFGRVAAQALAAGTPVIASRSGSLPEVIGECGELVSEGDAEAFGQRIRALLTEGDRWRASSECGRARAQDHFTWESVAEGVHQMYRELLRRNAPVVKSPAQTSKHGQ